MRRLGNASLKADELETFLIGAEAVINSRPLTYQYEDFNEPIPISPSDILVGRRLTTLPIAERSVEPTTISRGEISKQFRIREQLAAQFWEKWMKEYLQERNLQFRKDGRTVNIKVGEVVLIKEDNVKRRE